MTRWTDNDMFGHLNNAVYYSPQALRMVLPSGRDITVARGAD
jgi:acyl-ACP thioesterase